MTWESRRQQLSAYSARRRGSLSSRSRPSANHRATARLSWLRTSGWRPPGSSASEDSYRPCRVARRPACTGTCPKPTLAAPGARAPSPVSVHTPRGNGRGTPRAPNAFLCLFLGFIPSLCAAPEHLPKATATVAGSSIGSYSLSAKKPSLSAARLHFGRQRRGANARDGYFDKAGDWRGDRAAARPQTARLSRRLWPNPARGF